VEVKTTEQLGSNVVNYDIKKQVHAARSLYYSDARWFCKNKQVA